MNTGRYGWGVDGRGRQHIDRDGDCIVLFCVIPGQSVWDCIDLLELDDLREIMTRAPEWEWRPSTYDTRRYIKEESKR